MEKFIQPEYIPAKEEVIEIIKRHAENAIVTRELSDENGIYLLELKEEGEKPGKFNEYTYVRKGDFPNKQQSLSTTIYVTYYEDDIPFSGTNIAEYSTAEGWKEIK
ncbi:MAG: hypothetical protein WAV11_01995 [Minisyncoccia bacterium]